MAYIVMAYIVIACIVMAYIVTVCVGMAYMIMVYTGMAYIIMAYMVMAYTVMAYTILVPDCQQGNRSRVIVATTVLQIPSTSPAISELACFLL